MTRFLIGFVLGVTAAVNYLPATVPTLAQREALYTLVNSINSHLPTPVKGP